MLGAIRMRYRCAFLVAVLAALPACLAQSTNGLISGQARNVLTGGPLTGAKILATNTALNVDVRATTAANGRYALPALPPGTYRMHAEFPHYQPAELHGVEVTVAGYTEVDFELRPLSQAWEQPKIYLKSRYIVDIYGPDSAPMSRIINPAVNSQRTLEATFSRVVDPFQLRDLPFTGRDVYTMLVTVPAISADAATARGLGLSAVGQRAYSSNFLLDGLEANNSLVSGPLLAIAPEAVQEYRISTNNWAAEFGNASGVIANVVTRSGGEHWHGVAYAYLRNEALNANGFQDNLIGFRRPVREYQPGFQAGGPVRRGRLFTSTALEWLRSRTRDAPAEFVLPSTEFVPLYTQPGSAARTLLEQFPAPAVSDGLRPTARWTASPPISINRALALQRIDLIAGQHRLTGRIAVASVSRPDFLWSPYSAFTSALNQPAVTAGILLTSEPRPALTSEFRAGWSRHRIGWNRPHPEIPTLSTIQGVSLPGSIAFYEFRNTNSQWEFGHNLAFLHGRHILKIGGAFLTRNTGGFLTAGRDGHYRFGTLIDFALGQPRTFSAAVARESLPGLTQPSFTRLWNLRQYSWFVQDAFRVNSRLALNFGLRAERFGAPSADGEMLLRMGETGTLAERVASASFVGTGSSRPLYSSSWNWAPRGGFSIQASETHRVVIRGAAGLHYDRPFDNLWQNVRQNSFVLPTWTYLGADHQFLRPVAEVLPQYAAQRFAGDFPNVIAFDRAASDPYAINYFLSVQTRAGRSWSVETAFHGSHGRRLFSTDQVNRPFSVTAGDAGPGNPDLVYNPALPLITWRQQRGSSVYHGLTMSAAYRGTYGQFYGAYTWAHAIDNQSDPLAGDFFDLDFTRIRPVAERRVAAFTRQFDANVDRGNADFDQKHNLVMFSTWDLSKLPRWARALRGWQLSHLAGFRTGFPFTVIAASTLPRSGGILMNNRADLMRESGLVRGSAPDVVGGRLILDRDAFAHPSNGRIGNLGRNALRAPGFFNIDLSLARWFAVSESASVSVRGDIFNVLNHANLDMPESQLGSPGFGIAMRGRRGGSNGFPAAFPFQESARQIQLSLRVQF
jgi:hypothetical protein